MSLQTPEVAAARIETWFKRNPAVAQTDANIVVLTKFISDHFALAGEVIIDELYLDLAYQSIGGKLQHLAGPEVQAEIQRAQQQAASLQAERREREKIEAEQLRRDTLRAKLEAAQMARQPGRASAMEGSDRVEKERQQEAENRQKAAQKSQRYAEFLRALSDANAILITVPGGSKIKHGATNEARKNAREMLKRKFPEFAGEVR